MSSKIEDGRSRVVIENVRPEVDGGRFAIKRTVGEQVQVEADVFADGHDVIRCLLLHRAETGRAWRGVAMQAIGNDRWRGSFTVDKLGRHVYTVMAWIDQFFTWRHDLARRNDAADIALALRIGATLVRDTAGRANGTARARLEEFAAALDTASTPEDGKRVGGDAELGELMARHGERRFPTTYAKVLAVTVEPERARYSTWYELFPRSCSDDGRHGRFKDCERRLPYIAAMGFDVLYMPPIHPIGTMFRKGPNNALVAAAGDPGSPWAIGADDGGHKAVHAELGTLDDFRHLVAAAREHGIDIAMDIAFQCAPDHPYVKEHPDWFRWRPDGTVQYAENPPKKYQDIYPFEFESAQWQELWQELKSVFEFWIGQGVHIFRVDNPHTKPFPMWEWLIGEIQDRHPDTIFLSEAFTRPKVMKRLAKLGYLVAETGPGRTRERTHYRLTDLGREALRRWAPAPTPFPRVQSEAVIRLLSADIVQDDRAILASLEAMRAELDDMDRQLEAAREAARDLPHRERELRLVRAYGEALVRVHRQWLDEVERELGA